jgi:hypothetical protein
MFYVLKLVEPKKITIFMEIKSILMIHLFVKLLFMLMLQETLIMNPLKFKLLNVL